MSFQRIAIVNRGEPAMRLINGVVEYNAEHGTDLRTIALYTDADRDALFVREADETFHLGAPFFEDENGARQVRYLDYRRLEEALVETRAEAVWVGWGFVAEASDDKNDHYRSETFRFHTYDDVIGKHILVEGEIYLPRPQRANSTTAASPGPRPPSSPCRSPRGSSCASRSRTPAPG